MAANGRHRKIILGFSSEREDDKPKSQDQLSAETDTVELSSGPFFYLQEIHSLILAQTSLWGSPGDLEVSVRGYSKP